MVLGSRRSFTDLSDSATIAETILPEGERVLVTEIIKSPANVDRSGRLMLAPSDYSLSRAAVPSLWSQDESAS